MMASTMMNNANIISMELQSFLHSLTSRKMTEHILKASIWDFQQQN